MRCPGVGGAPMTPEELADVLERLALAARRHGLLESTILRRRIEVTALAKWMAPRSPFDATMGDIERFLDVRHLSARSRYTWLAALHTFYAWAIRESLTDTDPTAAIVRPRLRRTLPRPIRSEDLEHALDGADAQMRVILLLAAYQGLRCQEIAGLERGHVLFDQGLLRVVRAKGGHERIVPLHPEVAMAIMRLPGRALYSPWVVQRPGGGPFTPARLSTTVSRYMKDRGIEATAHQLRHWFGTEMYKRSGHDIRMVQELMGHSSPITTAVYTEWTRPSAAAVVGALTARRSPGRFRGGDLRLVSGEDMR